MFLSMQFGELTSLTQGLSLRTKEQQPQGETGEAGSSGQQGKPNDGQQREMQLDMQTIEGQLEECVSSFAQVHLLRGERSRRACTAKESALLSAAPAALGFRSHMHTSLCHLAPAAQADPECDPELGLTAEIFMMSRVGSPSQSRLQPAQPCTRHRDNADGSVLLPEHSPGLCIHMACARSLPKSGHTCCRRREGMQQKLQVKVEELMEEFSKQWQPVMENLEVAEQAFDDVEGLPQMPGYPCCGFFTQPEIVHHRQPERSLCISLLWPALHNLTSGIYRETH